MNYNFWVDNVCRLKLYFLSFVNTHFSRYLFSVHSLWGVVVNWDLDCIWYISYLCFLSHLDVQPSWDDSFLNLSLIDFFLNNLNNLKYFPFRPWFLSQIYFSLMILEIFYSYALMFIPLGTIVPNSLIHSDSRTCDQSSQ